MPVRKEKAKNTIGAIYFQIKKIKISIINIPHLSKNVSM